MARDILSGDRELLRALTAIPRELLRQVDPIAKESLEPLRQQTQNNARHRRQPGRRPEGGHLDENIVIKKISGNSGYVRTFWVSLARRARGIGHLVEFGTAPHYQPRRQRMHPGARPFPFFAPAFESEKDEVVETFGRLTWRTIAASALRFGRKT